MKTEDFIAEFDADLASMSQDELIRALEDAGMPVSGCPKCGRKDLRTLTWRELGIEETTLGCWDCDWVTYPLGINADNWQQKMREYKAMSDAPVGSHEFSYSP